MSKRAEEAALKAYPEKIIDHVEEPGFVVKRDLNRFDRNVYIQGYEQAEKDNELTINDIKFIIDKYSELPIQYGPRLFNEILVQFNEILVQFNEQKQK